TDDGVHWSVISPDLTRNIKSHQQPSGGPIALDVSSAEFSDNTLDIEGSPLGSGEIWVGTDDGLVQLTRDGGLHWTNVTPNGAPRFARVETVAPSPLRHGLAYAIYDDHRSGNYQPYIYATADFGATWRKIVSGLPGDQYVRTVRPDIHNASVLYAGTEHGIWISYDGGGRWQSLQLNLPAVSVRDIRLQPTFDDIVIATHGRGLWILDDARAVHDLREAQAAGVEVFPLRTAYEYLEHSDIEDLYTWYSAANPPLGAIIDFYQAAPSKRLPMVQVLNDQGRVVRSMSGTHDVKGKQVPLISNDRSLNRAIWDFREDGPVQWMGAAREHYRGPKAGAKLPPGTYTVRVTLNGRALTRTVDVRPDPRATFTQAEYQALYEFEHQHYQEYSNVDVALNSLDALKKGLKTARAALAKAPAARGLGLVNQLTAVSNARDQLFSRLTANFQNDEDSVARPGALREDLEDFQGLEAPPLPPFLEYAAKVDERYRSVMRAYNEFVASVTGLNAALKRAGIKEVRNPQLITL
ncbi:MAG: hypothetical protein M3Z41_00835, partial [Candidatus Eremiobacteraeota bacterium]|nr:hypothetical protein [Candidatus Eremiobacteraeota bacterium]